MAPPVSGRRPPRYLPGKYVLQNIPGPPPPTADVPALDEEAAVSTAPSLREPTEQHRSNGTWTSCHGCMDPLGFALENYDAIGRWRTLVGMFPEVARLTAKMWIDARGRGAREQRRADVAHDCDLPRRVRPWPEDARARRRAPSAVPIAPRRGAIGSSFVADPATRAIRARRAEGRSSAYWLNGREDRGLKYPARAASV
jgi:hypothetical protein